MLRILRERLSISSQLIRLYFNFVTIEKKVPRPDRVYTYSTYIFEIAVCLITLISEPN